MTLQRRQQGIALLVALLTVALAAILIASLLDRGELAYAKTRNLLRSEQAEAYADGVAAYAAKILLKDLADDQGSDTNADIWAQPLPPQPVPGGLMSATMRDLNGCFNLNDLADADAHHDAWRAMFRRLLGVRGVDPAIADAVVAWLGADADASDALDGYYLSLRIPYRSAQHTFVHVSELRLVRGVDGEVYARLAPFVCALPPGTRINVNTASVPVLQALSNPPMTQAEAESLWQNGQARYTGAFVEDWARQNVVVDPALASLLGTESTYFLARADITLDDVPFSYFALMERRVGVGIRVIERSRGSDDALAARALDAVRANEE